MYMDELEIISKFKKADNKREMLQVLADLNGCSKDEMKAYLLEHGISEDDFPKRGRKPKVEKEDMKKEVKEEVPHMESIKTVAQRMEIPEPVLRVIAARVEVLTKKIMKMDKERDCLCDYLKGVVYREASEVYGSGRAEGEGKTPVQHADWQSFHTKADSQL